MSNGPEGPPGAPATCTTAAINQVSVECRWCDHTIETRIRGPTGSIRCRECGNTTRVQAESSKEDPCPWLVQNPDFIFPSWFK